MLTGTRKDTVVWKELPHRSCGLQSSDAASPWSDCKLKKYILKHHSLPPFWFTAGMPHWETQLKDTGLRNQLVLSILISLLVEKRVEKAQRRSIKGKKTLRVRSLRAMHISSPLIQTLLTAPLQIPVCMPILR